MTATLIHVTTDGARLALAFGLVFIFALLVFAAVAWWLEEKAPERDEDAELESYYEQFRRLPL